MYIIHIPPFMVNQAYFSGWEHFGVALAYRETNSPCLISILAGTGILCSLISTRLGESALSGPARGSIMGKEIFALSTHTVMGSAFALRIVV